MKQKICNIRKQSGVISVLLVFLLGVVSGAVYWVVPIAPDTAVHAAITEGNIKNEQAH